MAELKSNNILGTASLNISPSGVLATSFNFIDPYSYAIQYQPELAAKLHMKHGRGKITGFLKATGSEESYASDEVKHSEMGRLHQISENVSVAGDVFTCGTAHNLRVNETIIISDGIIEKQAIVSEITSSTVFVGENKEAGAFGFTGNVTVSAFSNTWDKGEENFTTGRKWTPDVITNYTHILKEFYQIAESDMAHITWVDTPFGDMWYNLEMIRTVDLYDNKIELTHILNRRAEDTSAAVTAGLPKGMKGVVQQIEERGNIMNEYITDIEELSEIAYRAKQQGNCRAYTVWCDHQQMAYFRQMMAGLNAGYVGGTNYGVFGSKEKALSLDFNEVEIDGVTFFFTSWSLLDDPTLLGANKFMATSIAYLFVPAGDMAVMEDGNQVSRPYLSIRYRKSSAVDRYKKTEIFGGRIGTPHKKDTMEVLYTTEQTNQVVGANQYFVGRRGSGIYTGS